MKLLSSLLASAFLVAKVFAHGGVESYVVNGVEYPGFNPLDPPDGQSVVQWVFSNYGPLLSASDPMSRCNNPGTGPAAKIIPVKAGSTITAKWQQQSHPEGPVMVYMARVGGRSSRFSSHDGRGKVWFKIAQTGLISGTVNNGSWGAGEVKKNMKYDAKIPARLAPGKYLIRHELIALHVPNSPQYYMQCAQLVVSGRGSAKPSRKYLASFPGTYDQDEPSLNINIYETNSTEYTPPGPAVWRG